MAVIGVGHQGKHHVQKLANHPKVLMVGVADTNPCRGKEISIQYQVPFFQDYSKLFGQVDAVCIAVPVTSHFPIARDFLEKDTDVFIEKAITHTVEEGQALIHLAKQKNKILHVGHSERFNEASQLMKNKLQAPNYLEAYRLAGFSARGCDVDVILDLMIHDIDMVLHLLGEEPSEVNAIGTSVVTPHIDIADVHMRFPNNCEVHLKASRASPTWERSMKAFEKDRCLVANYILQELNLYKKVKGKILIEHFSNGKRDILEQQINAFIESVEKRIAPPVNGKESLMALHLAHRIRKSLKEPPSREVYLYGNTSRRSEKAI